MTPFAIAGVQMHVAGMSENVSAMHHQIDLLMGIYPWVQMVLFSELCVFGPSLAHAQSMPGPAEELLQKLAQRHGIWLIPGSMYERLDGGGYPEGLSGERIRLTARILGVCDVFCARIEPRSYRAGISPKTALDVLEQNSGRYDPAIVNALGKVVNSVTGEKLIAGVAAA